MKKFVLVVVCLCASCLFLGCSESKIEFRRDSKVSEVMKNVQPAKPMVRQSSGLMIYKDTQSSSSQRAVSPKDVNFDLKIKF